MVTELEKWANFRRDCSKQQGRTSGHSGGREGRRASDGLPVRRSVLMGAFQAIRRSEPHGSMGQRHSGLAVRVTQVWLPGRTGNVTSPKFPELFPRVTIVDRRTESRLARGG